MAFSRFFGRGRDSTPAPEAQAPEDDAPDLSGDVDDVAPEEDSPEAASARTWRERAEAALPTGASTGSKRAAALWGDDAPSDLPTHFATARGCLVIDVDPRLLVEVISVMPAMLTPLIADNPSISFALRVCS